MALVIARACARVASFEKSRVTRKQESAHAHSRLNSRLLVPAFYAPVEYYVRLSRSAASLRVFKALAAQDNDAVQRRLRFKWRRFSDERRGASAAPVGPRGRDVARAEESTHCVLVALQKYPWLAKCVHATTSRYRTQDMSLVLWSINALCRGSFAANRLVFILMIRDFGLPYVWICVGNLLSVLLLQYLAQIGRPVDLDSSLYERAHTDPDTYGFPCVDSHMSVVVLLPVILYTDSPVVQTALAFVVLYLGIAKLFVATRFASQVVGSWLTGLAGILVGNHGHAVLKTYKLSRGYNTGVIVVLIVFLMYVVGTWIENNESRLLGVPKQDYMDVIANILNSDAPASSTASSPADSRIPQVAAVH